EITRDRDGRAFERGRAAVTHASAVALAAGRRNAQTRYRRAPADADRARAVNRQSQATDTAAKSNIPAGQNSIIQRDAQRIVVVLIPAAGVDRAAVDRC